MKFQQSREDLRRVKEYSNALCAEYGLSTIRIEKTGNSLDYGEWRGEKQGVSWRSMLKADIDQALQYCLNPDHFIPQMRARGYEVKQGQQLAFRAPGIQRLKSSKESNGANGGAAIGTEHRSPSSRILSGVPGSGSRDLRSRRSSYTVSGRFTGGISTCWER